MFFFGWVRRGGLLLAVFNEKRNKVYTADLDRLECFLQSILTLIQIFSSNTIKLQWHRQTRERYKSSRLYISST